MNPGGGSGSAVALLEAFHVDKVNALLDDYFTDDYNLHSPAGDFNREEIKTDFAASRVRCLSSLGHASPLSVRLAECS